MNATLTHSKAVKGQAILQDTAGQHHVLQFDRRRYGKTTFTWVSVQVNGQWVSLGDPWPCIMPSKAELQESIGQVLAVGKA